MNGPINSAGAGSFTSSLKAISDLGKTSERTVAELQDSEFSDLIDQQNAIPGLLEALQDLLPEQDFSQIEAFISGGNRLPPAAVPGSEFELNPSESMLPIAATLSVVSQQRAAAQIAAEAPAPAGRLPLSETALLPTLRDGKLVTANAPFPGIGVDTVKAAPSSADQSFAGFTSQLVGTDLESLSRSRSRSALQESASAVTINPMSALKAAETAVPMRFSSPAAVALDTPLASRGWEQGVGDRILWMLGNSVQGVSMRINPAHLGPVEIKLSMHQDQATVTFNAQHAVVREALEASIPRLREMFQENNLQLAQVDVGQRGNSGQHTAGGGARDGQDGVNRATSDLAGYDSADTEEQAVIQTAVDGLLNDYA